MFRLPSITVNTITAGALCCLVVSGCGERQRDERPAGSAAARIEAVRPKGTVSWPVTFEWNASGAGPNAVYHVTVYDALERQLFDRETRATRWDAPGELQRLRTSNETFQWRVAMVDDAGNVLAQTGLTEFTLK